MTKGDLWANPIGTRQCIEAPRLVWKLYEAEERLAWRERVGEHTHRVVDWQTFLDFTGRHLRA